MGIHRARNDLAIVRRKFGNHVGKGDQLRGADKGKVQGIEEEENPLALLRDKRMELACGLYLRCVLLEADLLKSAVDNRLTRKCWGWLGDLR